VNPCESLSHILSLTSNRSHGQPGLLRDTLCKKLLPLSILALPTLGLQHVYAASAPDEVTGIVYSRTAAEIFWPRVSGQVVAYAVTRNGVELGVFDALSYFDDTLVPNNRYVFSVASVEVDGTRSGAVSTEIIVGDVGDLEPTGDLSAPANVSQTIYSATATEFFWDRVNTSRLVYEIRLNGEPVNGGISKGTSSYIDSLGPGADYTFTIVAVAADSSSRSEPVEFSFQMPGGSEVDPEPPGDEPIANTAAETTLENVLRIINTNAHDRVKFDLFSFDFFIDVPAPGLTALDANAAITENRTFDCSDGGTLEARPQDTGVVVFFNECALDNKRRNGRVIIRKATDDDVSINLIYSEYQETQIAANPIENVVVEIPNGIFAKSENWGDNYSRETMATPLLYTIITRAGVERVRDLQRTSSYYRDREDPMAAVELRASFIVESFWTSGNLIEVRTPTEFSNPDSVYGFYKTGKITIVEKTTVASAGTEMATGNSIELDASTGDANTYLLTVTEGAAVVSELRNWADLPEALPCPISALGAALQEECQ